MAAGSRIPRALTHTATRLIVVFGAVSRPQLTVAALSATNHPNSLTLLRIFDAPTIGRAVAGVFITSLIAGFVYAGLGYAFKRP